MNAPNTAPFFSALLLAPATTIPPLLLLGLFPQMQAALLFAMFAPLFGAPFYLVVGGPVLWAMHKRPRPIWHYALAGFVVNGALLMLAIAGRYIPAAASYAETAVVFLTIGMFFATLWGAGFGWLIRNLKPKVIK